jgi:hypothetical protein
MPQHFLLACPCCERQLTIEPSQAGQRLTCDCGAEIAAPTFREIKQLEPAGSDEEAPRPKWSRLQGVMFSLGILLVLAAIALGVSPLRQRSMISLEKPPPPDLTSNYNAIDDLTPEQSLQVWEQFLSDGVNRQGPPLHIALREIAGKLELLIGIAALLAVVGLVSTIGSFFLGPKR